MTEEFVTLETAKILKEKGFNEPYSLAINVEDSRQYTTSRTNSELPIKVCNRHNPSPKNGYVKPRTYIFPSLETLAAMAMIYAKLIMALI